MPQTNVRELAASLLVRDVEQSKPAVTTVDGSEDPLTSEEQLLAFRKEWLGEWSTAADEVAEITAEVEALKAAESAELGDEVTATFKGLADVLSPTTKAFGAMVEAYMSPASDDIKTEVMKDLQEAAEALDDEVVENILVDALGLSRPTEEFRLLHE